jgi:transposase
MGRAYSRDLRERIAGYIARGGSRRAAARHFGVSPSTAVRIAAQVAERGTLEPRRIGRPPGRGKLAPYVTFLVEIVEAVGDIALTELAAALAAEHGVRAHPSSISRLLIRAGMTYKKSPSRRRSVTGPRCGPNAPIGPGTASRAWPASRTG